MKIRLFLLVLLIFFVLSVAGCRAHNSDLAYGKPGNTTSNDSPVEEEAIMNVPADDTADNNTDSKRPEESAVEKTVLTIGGVACSQSQLKIVIDEFNKTSSNYIVTLKEYGTGASIDQAQMKMQTELLAGNRPDMLIFEDYIVEDTQTGEIWSETVSPLAYISSGMLLDLDEFVKNDSELDANNFIIWDALHEFDGMYLIGPKFYVETVYTLQETAEKYAGWTLEDYINIQNSLAEDQDMFYGMTPQLFIRRIGCRYIHEAVDVENATCNFENPEFVSLLKTACDVKTYNTGEKHLQPDLTFKSAEKMMADGELMFSKTALWSASDVGFARYNAYGWHEPYDPKRNNLKGECGERMAYIGYPTPDGKNGSYIKLLTPIGICAGTEHSEGCWEFIRYMLQNPVYQNYDDGTPVLESELAENLQYMIKDLENARWPVDQADQDALVLLARNCTSMSFYDEDILTIIEEEAAEVLAGNITAEQAAARVQNRASVLVMERYG